MKKKTAPSRAASSILEKITASAGRSRNGRAKNARLFYWRWKDSRSKHLQGMPPGPEGIRFSCEAGKNRF
jgi:hypothetical protein